MGSGQDSPLRPADGSEEPGPPRSRRSDFAPVAYGTLEAACRRLTASELEVALRDRYLPVSFAPEPTAYVAAGRSAVAAAQARDRPVVGTADPRDLVEALQAVYGGDICGRAASHLLLAEPRFSARRRISPSQAAGLSGAAAGFAVLWYSSPGAAAIAASLGFSVVFLAVCAIRLLGLLPAGTAPRPPRLGDAELPVYTVLVPLFRESRVLDQLVDALCRLDYPAAKLDIKLILESTDIETRRHVDEIPLPPSFEVLVVPEAPPADQAQGAELRSAIRPRRSRRHL